MMIEDEKKNGELSYSRFNERYSYYLNYSQLGCSTEQKAGRYQKLFRIIIPYNPEANKKLEIYAVKNRQVMHVAYSNPQSALCRGTEYNNYKFG